MVNDLLDVLRTVILALVGSVVQVLVESFEVVDGKDDTARRPCPECMSRVLLLEPSNECAWIASTDDNPVRFTAEFFVLLVDEVSNVGESLV